MFIINKCLVYIIVFNIFVYTIEFEHNLLYETILTQHMVPWPYMLSITFPSCDAPPKFVSFNGPRLKFEQSDCLAGAHNNSDL